MLSNKTVTAVMTLAKCERFQEAASLLDMSPATFSRHIQTAEAYAGVPLFTRARNTVQPTAEGETFLRHAREFHEAAIRFESATRLKQTAAGGRVLNISCGPLTTRALVAPALREAVNRFPGLRFKVSVRADSEPMIALKRREIDLFVGDLTHTAVFDDIEIRVVEKKPVIFVAAAGHPLLRGGPHPLPEILRYPLLSPFLHRHWRNTIVNAVGEDPAAQDLVESFPAIECDDFALLVNLLEDGNHVCGGMRETFSEGLISGRFREIRLSSQILWNVSIVRRKELVSEPLQVIWSHLLGQPDG